ncbi:uncharacterized protein PFL1_03465 [Pseudozyma flocculosa PF-1]|uniref:DH domain-containing protein n=2 Tax=Pseudozyma flocculosa TaxID=84751 RepID=A0A5C3FAT3_9BASI|nr:uncharacterized protein PFL1_03465 [Pseudozyma flocculosa PF-1]EPQ29178.1 hypothetical protein PFL1_03465 [Pseudozyma flocculosa PF-1]SPO41522.1 uncharacterized protein PSFLO_07004 [Pseudozyma flocculosa]
MSAAQATPRPTTLNLSLDKSLPPAPTDQLDEDQLDTLATSTEDPLVQLPDRPALQRHWTSAAPEASTAAAASLQSYLEIESPEVVKQNLTPSWRPLDLSADLADTTIALAPTARLGRQETVKAGSSNDIDLTPSQLHRKADSADSSGRDGTDADHATHRDSFFSAAAHPSPETFFSPCMPPSGSPDMARRSASQSRSRCGSRERSSTAREAAQAPLHGRVRNLSMHSTLQHDLGAAAVGNPSPGSIGSTTLSALERTSGYFSHLPDPSSFPLPSSSRMGSYAEPSPGGARLSRGGSRGNSHYSSDMSVRNSTSTRGSLWTERSQTSCNTSPGGPHSSLGFEPFPKDHGGADEPAEETEEIDEHSVGLGITSNDGLDALKNRRSGASPVVPSNFGGEGSPALSGPFSHHRAPSWTRKSDLAGLAMLSLDGGANALDAYRPAMVRTTSELSPKEFQRSRLAEDGTPLPPHVPLRTQSRQRCSSEASHGVPRTHAKNSSSISSTFSSYSASSSRMSPSLPVSTDDSMGIGLSRTLSSSTSSSSLSLSRISRGNPQSPPRSSSLRQSESTAANPMRNGSLRRAASIRRKAFTPQPGAGPTQAPLAGLAAHGEHQFEPAAEVNERAPSFETTSSNSTRRPATSDAATASTRPVSDVSINSFLQGAEFSHILGAYADRFRWDEDGLYGFDESAETEDELSQAVKTAQDGSAAIVHANGRPIAEVEKETGPNTTHLVLRDCSDPNVLEVLERVLPSTQRLLVLDVSGCKLDSLPLALGNCLGLEELDVSRNPLGEVPDFVSNLRALRVLSADNAGLRALPQSLSRLQELQCLGLRNNLLTHLPNWLHRLGKLDRLMLEGNAFKGVWHDVVSPILASAGKDRAPETETHPARSSSGLPHPPGPASPTSRSLSARRLRSIGDFHKAHWASDTSTPTSPEDESTAPSSAVSPTSGGGSRLPFSSSAADVNDGMSQFGALSETSSTPGSRPDSRRGSEAFEDAHGGPGKWGFLKKIGRKASSSRLGVMYTDHIAAGSESRTLSPKPSRATLRNSGGAPTRPRSRSGSSSALGFRGSMSPPPLPPAKLVTLAESGLQIPTQVPMTPFSPAFPPSSTATPAAPAADGVASLAATSRQARRRSFLPVHGLEAIANASSTAATSAEAVEELDAAALARHRQRLRALMHYLRDLEDLTTVRPVPANGSPVLREQASLTDASSADSVPSPMTRNSSIASGDSSASSMLFRSSASLASTSASTPSAEDGAQRRSASSSEDAMLDLNVKDDSVRRMRIIDEIVRTEETYVRGLQELVEIYVKPAQLPADGQGGAPVVPQSEQRAVFGNVEAILRFHAEVFLPALRSAARPLLDGKLDHTADGSSDFTAAVAESVASVFTHHAAFFKMYMSYINSCDSAQMRINVWMAPTSVINAASAFKSNSLGVQHAAGGGGSSLAGTPLGYDFGLTPTQRKKIKAFMKRCRTHPRHSQLNVESYLLLPVQRIPRYRLLIEDLVRSTDPSRLRSPDALSSALDHVSRIASNVNESKRQSEQDRRLLAWQYRIRGAFDSPLVQPHRRLVKDGPLRLRRVVKRVPGFIRQALPCATGSEAAQPRSGDSAQVMQVDHLTQSSQNLALTVLLCNDVVVLVNDPSGGRDASSPVSLYAMLRLEKPVEIVGGLNLRLVDRKGIIYLSAGSSDEAIAWKTALNAQLP